MRRLHTRKPSAFASVVVVLSLFLCAQTGMAAPLPEPRGVARGDAYESMRAPADRFGALLMRLILRIRTLSDDMTGPRP